MEELEQRILQTIDERAGELIAFAEDIYGHAEPGFQEVQTAEKVSRMLQSLGLTVREKLAVTGVKAKLKQGGGITIAAIGELDGVNCPSHIHANPASGYSHTCGHHCQLAAMIGSAMALTVPEVAEAMDGNVAFFAVPSEEYNDLEHKSWMMQKGIIRYGSGKSELIRLGEFDDINISMVHHLHMVDTYYDVLLGMNSTNGFIMKLVNYTGKAAHGAIAPHKGINALNAASLALSALAYQRETFKESDYVRVHAIISEGGRMVNVVPDHVVVECQVRAKTMSAMLDANHKANRSFEAGAHAIGAGIQINDMPGYLPVLDAGNSRPLDAAARAAAGGKKVSAIDPALHNPASTDVGDLCHLMPVLAFTTGGFKGSLHSADFEITDKYLAYVLPAKIMALTIFNALKNSAFEARRIMDFYPQHLTKKEYLEYMDGFINQDKK
ncbi:amidohydrolase [Acetanaerobacterium elongatum]|uniref:Amidohydrolase n=1 Tax=Acetanaerobacterium elongatum TaxID=258515 RepID=A0A1H0GVR6_9FIRM|nr:amidohydrolase [Acetanaerobacterium elongatum]SDO11136.1 amidohydrolase [Acetanaerobacterium elongatum]